MTDRPLYEILGLEKGASADAVEKAYRQLAREHHPDRGGDEATFKAINEAYAILADPQRRARYDRDGTWDNAPNVDHAMLAVIGLLSTTLITVLSRISPDQDVQKAMLNHLQDAKRHAVAPMNKLKGARKQVEQLAGRFSTDGEQNLMEEIVSQHLWQMQAEIDRIEADSLRFDRAIEVLKKYKYRFDQPGGGLFMPGSWRNLADMFEPKKVEGAY